MKPFTTKTSVFQNLACRSTASTIKVTPFPVIGVLLLMPFILFLAGCKKENEVPGSFDYELLYNTKWLTIAQPTTPTWTYPVNGKSYNDLWDFTKDEFPCLVDDYIVFNKDGSSHSYYSTLKCDPTDPSVEAPVSFFVLDKPNDSLFLVAPLEIPGRKTEILMVRAKILELRPNKLVFRFYQIVPFTNTRQLITNDLIAIP